MITLTTSVQEKLADRSPGDGMAWLINIHWDRGDVEKVVERDGLVTFKRQAVPHWRVDLFGDRLETLAAHPHLERHAPLIFVQPWLLPNPRFPGGEVDVEDGSLVFRASAA
jgi:hypothetical protein